MLVILFFICWTPTCIEQILYMAKIEVTQSYADVAITLMIANSAINPFLYCLTKKDFRSKLQVIFWCSRGKEADDTTRKSDKSSASTRGVSRRNQNEEEAISMNGLQKQETDGGKIVNSFKE